MISCLSGSIYLINWLSSLNQGDKDVMSRKICDYFRCAYFHKLSTSLCTRNLSHRRLADHSAVWLHKAILKVDTRCHFTCCRSENRQYIQVDLSRWATCTCRMRCCSTCIFLPDWWRWVAYCVCRCTFACLSRWVTSTCRTWCWSTCISWLACYLFVDMKLDSG